METIDLTPIIQITIMLAVVIITSFIIPWIKSKTTQEQWWTVQNIAKVAVYAAEVLYKGSGRGAEKLNYVTTYIKEFCLSKGFTIDDKTIRQSIENAWDEMTNAKAKKDKVA